MTNTRKLLEVDKKLEGLRRKTRELEKEKEKLKDAVTRDAWNKINCLRRKRGLSLEGLAQEVSMPKETLVELLSGETPPNKATRESIARSLGVPRTELWAF